MKGQCHDKKINEKIPGVCANQINGNKISNKNYTDSQNDGKACQQRDVSFHKMWRNKEPRAIRGVL